MKKLLAFATMLCLLLGCVCSAESAIDLTDMTVTFADGASYTFPMSLKDAEAAGLNVPENLYDLEPGYTYFATLTDREGEEEEFNRFNVNVACNPDTPGTPWINGVTLTAYDNVGGTIGGMTVGTTTCEAITAVLGPDKYGETDGDSLNYLLYNGNVSCSLEFDGGVLKRVALENNYVTNFGTEFAACNATGKVPEGMELNELIIGGKLYIGSMPLTDLLNNGWKLSSRYDLADEIKARRNNSYYGKYVELYDGEHMITVFAANTKEEAAPLSESRVLGVQIDAEWGPNCVVTANGLNIGSTYDEVIAALGEPVTTGEPEEGITRLNYNLVIMNTYTWTVDIDNATNTVVAMNIGI